MTNRPVLSADVLRRFDVPGPRYTSYPTVPEWSADFDAEAYGRHLEAAGRDHPTDPLSLYVHLPFCAERCTFCGCNVVVTKDRARADQYLAHLAMEMDLVASRLGPRRTLTQVHFGGGTPTFLGEEQLFRLWAMIEQRFEIDASAEISVEIDPVVTTKSQLQLLRWLGANRLSMGIQDFDPTVQAGINRVQTVEETRELLEEARRLGFGGVSFDLIYGLPQQTPESWAQTLAEVIALSPDRAAVYSFAWVPDARPHQKRLAVLPMASGMAKLELFGQAYERFVSAGYRPIGMDHFARPEDELSRAQAAHTLRRNFQGYTVSKATEVIAFGVSGISDLASAYAQNVQALPKYYARVANGKLATERGIELTADDRRRRQIIEGLMCNFHVELGGGAEEQFGPELEALEALEHEGLVEIHGTTLDIPEPTRVLVRNVAMVFDSYLKGENARTYSRTV